MKHFMRVLAILAVTGLAGTAFAAPKIQRPQVLVGKIGGVDAATGDVVVAVEGQHGKAGQQVTVATDANTKVSIDGKAAWVDDLKADMLVGVKPATGTAAEIDAKSPPPPPPLPGKVVSVDTATGDVVVQPEHGQQVTVTTGANTQVSIDGKAATVDDLKADMLVKVTLSTSTAPAGDIDAKSPPPPPPLRGKAVSVDAATGDVVVQPEHGQQVTVATDANAKVSIDGKAATVDDLKTDMPVKITFSTSTGPATEIDAKSPPPPPPVLVGLVVSVDPATGNVVVTTINRTPAVTTIGGRNVTVPTDANTKITIDGNPATLADLKAGMFVEVKPGTGTATDIQARSAPTPPPPPVLVGLVVSVDLVVPEYSILLDSTGLTILACDRVRSWDSGLAIREGVSENQSSHFFRAKGTGGPEGPPV